MKDLVKKRGPGQPPRVIPWEQIERMAMVQCSTTEIIMILGISSQTLYDAAIREKGVPLGEYLDKFREVGKLALRRKQHEVALKGNVTMLRWLGIQHLEQSPEVVVMHKAPGSASPTDETAPPQPEAPSGFKIRGLPEPQADPNVIDAEGRTVEDRDQE